MNIDIPEPVADKLRAIADGQHKAPADVVVELINDYAARSATPPGSFAALARSAAAADIRCDKTVDTAARSRAVLNEVYAEHIERKQRDRLPSAD